VATTTPATPDPTPEAVDSRDFVPPGMRIAGAWAWRLLAIVAVLAVLVFLVMQLRLIVVPFLVGILLAALLVPFSQFLQKHRWPKWLAVAVSEVGVIAVIAGLLVLVVRQVTAGIPELQSRWLERYQEIKDLLLASPLHLTNAQITDYLDQAWQAAQQDTAVLLSGALSVGSTAGHIITGALLALFTTLFILIDGRSIWSWVTRLFPKRARAAVNGAGEAGWRTLTSFVKVQIFVAAVDAVGIGIGAAFFATPLAVPIAVAVFLGSFIPVVGALLTGALAVAAALVFSGPWAALFMVIVVVGVQQLEGHVLQPLIVGSAVKIHPLAIVLAVATGGFVAGIPGALFAVPFVATLNVMVVYIASGEWRRTGEKPAAVVVETESAPPLPQPLPKAKATTRPRPTPRPTPTPTPRPKKAEPND
jgi:putative heme transporter